MNLNLHNKSIYCIAYSGVIRIIKHLYVCVSGVSIFSLAPPCGDPQATDISWLMLTTITGLDTVCQAQGLSDGITWHAPIWCLSRGLANLLRGNHLHLGQKQL